MMRVGLRAYAHSAYEHAHVKPCDFVGRPRGGAA